MKDTNQFDLAGIYHDFADDAETRIVESYRELWKAVGSLFPEDWLIREQVPVGFIQPPDWAEIGEMPPCSDSHVKSAVSLVKEAIPSITRLHKSIVSAGEERCLINLRNYRLIDAFAPHFGYRCRDWGNPYFDEEFAIYWLEKCKEEGIKQSEFGDAVFEYVQLPEATDLSIVRRIKAIWVISPNQTAFERKLIDERYLHHLQYAGSSGSRPGYPALGRARRRKEMWPDIERAFITAVMEGSITTLWDGTIAETMSDTIALKERYDIPLTQDEIEYTEAKSLSRNELRKRSRERVIARARHYRSDQDED